MAATKKRRAIARAVARTPFTHRKNPRTGVEWVTDTGKHRAAMKVARRQIRRGHPGLSRTRVRRKALRRVRSVFPFGYVDIV